MSAIDLHSLSREKKLCFCALVLERMVPNFIMFELETHFLGSGILLAALARVWYFLEHGSEGPLAKIDSSLCMSIAPDTEMYTSIYTSAALDASAAAANLMDYIDGGADSLLDEILVLSLDTIEIFVQTPDNSQIIVEKNNLVSRELEFRAHDYLSLKTAPETRVGAMGILFNRTKFRKGSLAE